MAKKLELKFLTSANTELIVSIADPKDGLALSAVQACLLYTSDAADE